MLAFVVLMILPPAATAASGADPSNPSLDQYVESVPSSHGDKTPPSGSSRGHLSSSVRHQIASQGGGDAKQLEAVATSPSLGAPATTNSGAPVDGGRRAAGAGRTPGAAARPPLAIGERGPSGLHAIATAATQDGGSSISALVAGLVLITALAGGMALARRRYDTA